MRQPRIIRTRLVALAPGWWRARLTWSDGIETVGHGLTPHEAEMDGVSPIPSGFLYFREGCLDWTMLLGNALSE